MKKFSHIHESISESDLNRLMTEKVTELLASIDPKNVEVYYASENDAKSRNENDQGLNIIVSMPEEPLDQCIEEIQMVKKIIQDNFKIKRDTIRSHGLIKMPGSGKFYDIYFLISEEDMRKNNIFVSLLGINKFDL